MLHTGKLDRRIVIEAPARTKGAAGGHTATWSAVGSPLFAAVRNLSGSERRLTKQGGQVAEERTEFTIHYREGITAEMRVVYRGRFYNIRHVNNFKEADRYLVLTCDTGLNNG